MSLVFFLVLSALAGTGHASYCEKGGEECSTTKFDPEKSSSFVLLDDKPYLNVHYADTSFLRILTMEDVVQLGSLQARTRLGVIISRPTTEFAQVDGILGFGYTSQKGAAGLLVTLSKRERPSWGIVQDENFETLDKPRFAFLADSERGELQLGDYDRNSIVGELNYTKMLNAFGYGINITSIVYGETNILASWGDIVAVMDTGASCLTFPSISVQTAHGHVDSPYSLLLKAAQQYGPNSTLKFVTAEGTSLEMPASAWTMPGGCIMSHTLPYNVLILGDPFFRRYLVHHDMSTPEWRIGIGLINPEYKIGRNTSSQNRFVMNRTRISHTDGIVKLSIESHHTRYTMQLGVGTPAQWMTVIFDTGSTLLAVFPTSSFIKKLRGDSSQTYMMWTIVAMIIFLIITAALIYAKKNSRAEYEALEL